MKTRALTKKPMLASAFKISTSDKETWRAAAAVEEISQSEFLRRAIRERARGIFSERDRITRGGNNSAARVLQQQAKHEGEL